jgi:hypothetical protein
VGTDASGATLWRVTASSTSSAAAVIGCMDLALVAIATFASAVATEATQGDAEGDNWGYMAVLELVRMGAVRALAAALAGHAAAAALTPSFVDASTGGVRLPLSTLRPVVQALARLLLALRRAGDGEAAATFSGALSFLLTELGLLASVHGLALLTTAGDGPDGLAQLQEDVLSLARVLTT